MKRYFTPVLVLVLLLLAGSSLQFRTLPPPTADVAPQTATEEPSPPVGIVEPTDTSDSAETEVAPTETMQPEPVPSSKLPPEPSCTVSSPVSAQSSSAPESAGTSTQTQAPPVEPEQTPAAPAVPAEPEPVSESQPKTPGADLSALAQDLLSGMNKERANSGADPLTLDSALSSVAAIRAKEGTTHFSHTRPDGSPYRSAVDNAGLSYRNLGENLATGHASAQAVLRDWNASDGHHDNIVNEHFTKVGIGLAKNNGNPYEGYTWAVVFSD